MINDKNIENMSLEEIMSDNVLLESSIITKNKDTIMVVDDDAHQLSSINKLLAKNFNIISCSNGNQAIRGFKENHNTIMSVLLDIRLPDMDGFEVFNKLKEISVNIPIIFITGYQDTYGDGFDIYKKYRPHGYIVKNQVNEVEMIMDSLINSINSYKHIIELERIKIYEEKNKMLAGLLHDLKNMFTPILMMPELIKRFLNLGDIDRTNDMLERLKKMVQFYNSNQMVLFQYSKDKNINVQLQSINIKKSLDEFLEIIEMQYSTRFPINVEYLYEGDIVSDKNTLFTQIILNIIKNSSDAFHINKIKNPQIDIKVMTYDDYGSKKLTKNKIKYEENIQLVIIISDNAGGLPKELEHDFFEPYVSKGKTDGTGLGSWMIKNGVEDLLNGQMFIDNRLGEGLSYHIFI
jgi:signal transduction histidine kinase